jgi:UDP:flavonoid glycosyltransferase YjiC (YdhE family)
VMRMLFTTLPGAGPFHPLVPFARSLQERGHEVAFATSRSYCGTVQNAGFHCFPAGCDWHLGDRETLYAHVKGLQPDCKAPFSPLAHIFAGFLPSPMVPDLLTLAQSWQPDVVVRDPMEFAGCVVAEVLGIPHAACGLLFSFWDGAWHGPPGEIGKPNLCDLRRRYGLSSDPGLSMLYRYLYLAFLPPIFPDPAVKLPGTVHFLRPVCFNQSVSDAPPTWLAHLPERPTVHASLGTVFHRTPGVFAAIIAGLRLENINLVVAIGCDQDPAAYGQQPPNVYIERYIAHSLLLPRCDVFVTHAGFSSVMAGLEQGLPMVAVPLAGDQPSNAQRCSALGVARVIGPDTRTPEAFRAAVREVLRNPSYCNNAARLRQEIQLLPGPQYAVQLLEKLVQVGRPILNSSQSVKRA